MQARTYIPDGAASLEHLRLRASSRLAPAHSCHQGCDRALPAHVGIASPGKQSQAVRASKVILQVVPLSRGGIRAAPGPVSRSCQTQPSTARSAHYADEEDTHRRTRSGRDDNSIRVPSRALSGSLFLPFSVPHPHPPASSGLPRRLDDIHALSAVPMLHSPLSSKCQMVGWCSSDGCDSHPAWAKICTPEKRPPPLVGRRGWRELGHPSLDQINAPRVGSWPAAAHALSSPGPMRDVKAANQPQVQPPLRILRAMWHTK